MKHPQFKTPDARSFLRAFGVISVFLWTGIALISREFAYGTTSEDRPFGLLAATVAISFVFYLGAISLGCKKNGKWIHGIEVILFAVLMRLPLLLFSHPVQEIDYYRYLWDGRVAAEGVSPYQFPPAALDRFRAPVDETVGEVSELNRVPESAAKLLTLLERSEHVETIFLRIDHREVPTVYPVVAEAVFATAAFMTPEKASIFVQMAVLRGLITLFDIATIVLLILLAKRLRLPVGFVILYAWCPLVLKEFANASHMDAIPVFFTVASLFALLYPERSPDRREYLDEFNKGGPSIRRRGGEAVWIAASSILLVLAIFAKWYPLIVVPVFASYAWSRLRWKSLVAAVPGIVVAVALLALTLGPGPDRENERSEADRADAVETSSGLRTFLTRWEMNDLIFSLVRENLRPVDEGEASLTRPEPWYAVTPNAWRLGWHQAVRNLETRLDGKVSIPLPDFVGAQLVCGILLLLIIAWTSLRKWDGDNTDAIDLGRRLFIVFAASWLLSATQNPWYWTWGLPFIGFARSKVWSFVSGISLLYYARFWLIYQFPEPFFQNYTGQRFFDEIVIWFEHGPVLLALAAVAGYRLRSRFRGKKLARMKLSGNKETAEALSSSES
ncbi:MAG: hypothetical protein P1U86_06940 [Verrucomicrobiales bacterium]|nr:hypothetical protein [Verrucomicrobiales bacterium]